MKMQRVSSLFQLMACAALAAVAVHFAAPSCAGAAAIRVGSTSAAPGTSADICLSLSGGAGQIAGVQMDLTWDESCATAELANGRQAACWPNSATGKSVQTSVTGSHMRALMLSLSDPSPIPDGELFCCSFMLVSATASQCCAIGISNVRGSNSAGVGITNIDTSPGQLCAIGAPAAAGGGSLPAPAVSAPGATGGGGSGGGGVTSGTSGGGVTTSVPGSTGRVAAPAVGGAPAGVIGGPGSATGVVAPSAQEGIAAGQPGSGSLGAQGESGEPVPTEGTPSARRVPDTPRATPVGGRATPSPAVSPRGTTTSGPGETPSPNATQGTPVSGPTTVAPATTPTPAPASPTARHVRRHKGGHPRSQ
jgi:hypothetical protein